MMPRPYDAHRLRAKVLLELAEDLERRAAELRADAAREAQAGKRRRALDNPAEIARHVERYLAAGFHETGALERAAQDYRVPPAVIKAILEDARLINGERRLAWRNRRIYAAWITGTTEAELAKHHQLTPRRIRQICKALFDEDPSIRFRARLASRVKARLDRWSH